MNFAEIEFWKLCLVSLGVIGIILWVWRRMTTFGPGVDKGLILALSLLLLGSASLETLVVFLAVSIGTYALLRLIAAKCPAPEKARLWLWLLLPLQFLPLVFYKYSWFLLGREYAGSLAVLQDLVIPLGLSFYTFQVVSFSIDTLKRGLPMPGFLDYMNYSSFFPQIVAGPIERRDHLLPQMEAFRFRWSAEDINEGVAWIVLGLFLKLGLADQLSAVRAQGEVQNAWRLWHDNVAFGFQIYYDFCGYSMIAYGIARCLGIRLVLNFSSPYARTSMGEFWRAWHISLTSWFKDYIYIPLGGSRTRFWMLVTVLVFGVSGLWHGAGWNFILWGALNGLFLVLTRLALKRVPGWVAWPVTMVLVFFCWMFFYETDMAALASKAALLFTPAAYAGHGLSDLWQTSLEHEQSLWLMVAAVTVLEALSLWKNKPPYFYLTRGWASAVWVFLLIFLVHFMEKAPNEFIYFAF